MTRGLVVLWLALAAVGCRKATMSAEACDAHLDRLIEIELRSRGFDDPELERRWKSELRRTLAPELSACATLPRDEHVLACTGAAADDGALWRDCLAHAHRPRGHEHRP